jgi:hypothetical protein
MNIHLGKEKSILEVMHTPYKVSINVSYWERIFAFFWPEKYDFNIYKDFFAKKKGPNLQDFWLNCFLLEVYL